MNSVTINGIEYIGSDTSGQWTTPSGASGQLLGVDAMREFNVQSDSYGVEYGKKAGGHDQGAYGEGVALHGCLLCSLSLCW